MKRILVLSDSHGNVNNMVTAVGRLHPDMIIHLGDCWADAEQLHRKFPMTVMEQVPGNCDCRQEVQERILLIEGKKILICHGHTFNVKSRISESGICGRGAEGRCRAVRTYPPGFL